MPQKDRVLITGANGLLGRHFINLYKDAYDIHAIVRIKPDQAIDGVTYHFVDLSKDWDIEALPADISTICHLAQSDKFRDFPDNALDVFDVNVASTAKLLDYAHKTGVKNFIYASSGGVYAQAEHAFHENSPVSNPDALGYYLGSKMCGEILVSNYSSLMTISILRFFFIYGAGQKRSMLLPRLVDNIRNGKAVTLQKPDGLSINPIHANDATKAVHACIGRSESATYNIAGKNVYTLKEIATIIGETTNAEPTFEYQDQKAANIVADINAMKADLHIPEISFEDGLKDIL